MRAETEWMIDGAWMLREIADEYRDRQELMRHRRENGCDGKDCRKCAMLRRAYQLDFLAIRMEREAKT